METKTKQAIFIGIFGWFLGAGVVILLKDTAHATSLAIAAGFLTAPLMYALTLFHLRGVSGVNRPSIAFRFGVIFTTVQFPLDALGFFSIFKLDSPALGPDVSGSIVIGLEIAYLFMMTVPILVGHQVR